MVITRQGEVEIAKENACPNLPAGIPTRPIPDFHSYLFEFRTGNLVDIVDHVEKQKYDIFLGPVRHGDERSSTSRLRKP